MGVFLNLVVSIIILLSISSQDIGSRSVYLFCFAVVLCCVCSVCVLLVLCVLCCCCCCLLCLFLCCSVTVTVSGIWSLVFSLMPFYFLKQRCDNTNTHKTTTNKKQQTQQPNNTQTTQTRSTVARWRVIHTLVIAYIENNTENTRALTANVFVFIGVFCVFRRCWNYWNWFCFLFCFVIVLCFVCCFVVCLCFVLCECVLVV